MIALTLALSSLGAEASHARWHQLGAYTFEMYKAEWHKSYASSDEHAMRERLFTAKLAEVRAHNAGKSSYKKGMNAFSDRTAEELKPLHGLDRSLHFHTRHTQKVEERPARQVGRPQFVDWRKAGAVTAVKNQGHCGSCWTFASAETLESHWYLKTGKLQDLSEQFILDCTPNPHQCGGTGGCAGGTAELAYARLAVLGGIPSEWTYPYLSGGGNASTCHGLPLPPGKPHGGGVAAAANVSGFVSLPTNSEEAIMDAVASQGPLAVSVDAGAWHDYESGIFDGGNATNPALDHLVQMVGFGSEPAGDYFLIRNSWTPLWGDAGYIKLRRYGPDDPHCGLDVDPLDGNGCKGGPPTVKVCGQNGVASRASSNPGPSRSLLPATRHLASARPEAACCSDPLACAALRRRVPEALKRPRSARTVEASNGKPRGLAAPESHSRSSRLSTEGIRSLS